MVEKVVACLLRSGTAGQEVLTFTHPINRAVQLPKGTVEPGESPRAAVLRELHEESGVTATIEMKVAEMVQLVPHGPSGQGPLEEQLWHVFALRSTGPTPDSWDHEATGSAEENGLIFSFAWLTLPNARRGLHHLYRASIDALMDMVS